MSKDINPAIAANIVALRATLAAAAEKAEEAVKAIEAGNRYGAIGCVAGLDQEIDLAKALYVAALGISRQS